VHTVGNQIAEAILCHRDDSSKAAWAEAAEMLARVGIDDTQRRMRMYPFEFSGGMRQRVVIAMALVCNPDLLICDEPTTALDVTIQAQILDLMRALRAQLGTAIVIITHDMGVIAETADRVAVMYAGRLVEVGPVRDVIKNPQHPYTVGLMNSIPSIAKNVKWLTQIDGAMPRLKDIPKGCSFNPRCPKVFDRCRVQEPLLIEVVPSHSAACWLHSKEAVHV